MSANRRANRLVTEQQRVLEEFRRLEPQESPGVVLSISTKEH
jgi:hypothetical protein